MLPKPSRISLFGGRCVEHKVNVLETQRPVMIQFLRRIEKIIYKLDSNVNVKRKKKHLNEFFPEQKSVSFCVRRGDQRSQGAMAQVLISFLRLVH